MIPEDIIPNTGKLQAFIKDEALNSIFNVMHIIIIVFFFTQPRVGLF